MSRKQPPPPPPPPAAAAAAPLEETKKQQQQQQKQKLIETLLTLFPITLIINQLKQQQPPPPHKRQLPINLLISLTTITTILASTTNYSYKVPFTDQRGYRQTGHHHALILAIGLPLILSATLYITTTNNNNNNSTTTTTNHHLMDIWNRSPHLRHSNTLHYDHADYHNALSLARLDLLAFTILNLYSLLLDISLARLGEYYNYLPISNSARLIASTLKSLFISILFSLALSLGWWGQAISQSMTPFECLFSVFTFQSCLYLTTRLARRAFTLAESSIFSSTGVALMIEVIRLTSARLRYSAYLLKQQQKSTPISDADRLSFLPSLFRFPTPAIAIQHVLVSGIFLMAFTLAPLLVLSRRLGQRPTKRTRHSTRSLSRHRNRPSPTRVAALQVQKTPIWTSEPAQPDYYQRFSNPDSQHHSRQHESALKENLRKIIALSIYASITWIGLVVMSHWLGWLFEIGRDRRIKQAWWRRILGPGWLGFFRYSFLSYPEGYHPGGSRSISDEAGGSGQQIRIRWTRIAILIYWWICLVLAIGGWTTYLVRKRRSGIRHPHLSRSPDLGRWSGWGSAWKNRIGFRLSRSSSRPRSNSPSTTATIPPSATTPTTLTGSISSSIFSPRQATPLSTETTTHNRSITPTTPTSASVKCSPSDLMGRVEQLIRRALPFSLNPSSPTLLPPSADTHPTDHPHLPLKSKSSPFISPLPSSLFSSLGRSSSPSSITNPHKKPSSTSSSSSSSSSAAPSATPVSPALTALTPNPLPGGPPSSLIVGSLKSQQLNFKRKFFHLLVCFMFIPTIPIDIEFSSISFSVAFVIFTFCEFARYFAFYPIGAGIHLFFNEFIDSKDSGPVILSHFYLLTACSTGIWLDGLVPNNNSHRPMRMMMGDEKKEQMGWLSRMIGSLVNRWFGIGVKQAKGLGAMDAGFGIGGCSIEDLIGVIILGVGDSCASVVGKRFGKIRWNVGSSKTVEGSVAFVGSVIVVSLGLRVIGLVQPFPIIKYSFAILLVSLLEAFTAQNDNLVLPLYSWSILKLLFLS
ncbi:hypothetical protein PGT21_007863 [Puccinia graminis f. sp. tritici]|uniref:dolichol kinase n=1 Tax=Puccinia graminis f. sp. tritici TaxID=56615 RepID=A0A5B0M0H7_PUCGR|nr:hypothetical protein PGT21_007863 [Puccinia graminis f. sp. tritici]KAA1090092.1 hypothetical protein PGTUg99_035480 [Puccinia graminis f. sp. tritici]